MHIIGPRTWKGQSFYCNKCRQLRVRFVMITTGSKIVLWPSHRLHQPLQIVFAARRNDRNYKSVIPHTPPFQPVFVKRLTRCWWENLSRSWKRWWSATTRTTTNCRRWHPCRSVTARATWCITFRSKWSARCGLLVDGSLQVSCQEGMQLTSSSPWISAAA